MISKPLSWPLSWPLRWCFALTLLALLTACGGSAFQPTVTAVKAQDLRYSQTATIYIGGTDLRNSLAVDLGPNCKSPSFSPSSTPVAAIVNCTVTGTGELPLTIQSANGQLLYKTTFTVPKPQVLIATSQGNITLELEPAAAPKTVDNFLQYVKEDFYSNTLFHRVIAQFMVQGGGFSSGMQAKSGLRDPIKLESDNGLSNLRGTVAMARTDAADSATSQFFINVVDNTRLDFKNASSPGYAVFGKVIQGLEVADAIAAVPTANFNGFSDVPTTDILITQITQIK